MYNSLQKSWYRYIPTKQGFIPLAVMVAEHAKNLIWGNGFHISSTSEHDKDLIDKIYKRNRLDEFFQTVEMDLSQNGNLFVTIDMIDGMPMLISSDAMMLSTEAVSYADTELAVIYKRITIDGRAWPIKEVWDREKVTRFWVEANGQTMTADNVIKKIPADHQISMEWRHNLGYVPVVHMRNKGGAHRMWSVSDGQFAKQIEQFYNDAMCTFNETEVKNNVTRLYAKLNKKDKKQITREAKAQGITSIEYMQKMQAIVETDFVGDKSGDGGNSPMQLIQGKLPAKEWWHHLNQLKAEYFENCGYSYQRPEQASMGNTGGTDVLFTHKKDVESTKAKLAVRQGEVNKLLQIIHDMINLHGKNGDVFFGDLSIDIKTSLLMDSLNEVEKASMKIDNGLTSRKREIMKLEGVSSEEADEILKEIDEEQKEYDFAKQDSGMLQEDAEDEAK